MQYRAQAQTSVGGRKYQEDSLLLWSPDANEPTAMLLAVLADGMGGHAGGALASRTVCSAFVDHFSASEDSEATLARLDRALTAANGAIARIVAGDAALNGMGSTVIGAAFGPDGLEWVSVGDSPMYLVRRGEIEVLNEDHSLAPALDQLAAAGKITVEQARNNPRRHMLRSAVAGEEMELVDRSHRPLRLVPGDWVILASDGIHTIEAEDIARLVIGYADRGPDAVAAALIREVEAARDPYQDNTTVIAVNVV